MIVAGFARLIVIGSACWLGLAAPCVAEDEGQSANQTRLNRELISATEGLSRFPAEYWLILGANPNAVDWTGVPALILAAARDDTTTMAELLSRGADPNQANSVGDTALHEAAHEGAVKALKLLLAAGAEVNLRGEYYATPLIRAACGNQPQAVALLCEAGADLEALDDHARSALHYAALFDMAGRSEGDAYNYVTTARALLQHRANPNTGAVTTGTPLHFAMQQASDAMFDLLLAYGADVNAVNCYGNTPLHFAGKYDRPQAAQWLVAHGAMVDDIFAAVTADDAKATRRIVERGVNVRVADWDGETPLDWAARLNSLDAALVLVELRDATGVTQADLDGALLRVAGRGYEEFARFLLDQGASLEARNRTQATPLILAAGQRPSLVRLLLDHGASVDASDQDGMTAVHAAAQAGAIEPALLLLDAGATVDALDADGDTPLFTAAARGQASIVELLLSRGADVHWRNTKGQAVLHVVAKGAMGAYTTQEQDFLGTARLLVQAGAELNVPDSDGYYPLDIAAPSTFCATGFDFELIDYLWQAGARHSQKWEDIPAFYPEYTEPDTDTPKLDLFHDLFHGDILDELSFQSGQ